MKLLKMGLQIGRILAIKCFLTSLTFSAKNFLVFLGVEDLHLVKLTMDIEKLILGLMIFLAVAELEPRISGSSIMRKSSLELSYFMK